MEGSIFFISAARREASKTFFCRHFVLSVKTLAVVGLLAGRVVFVWLHLSILGRRVGVLVVPRAASFAATSMCPECVGHTTRIHQTGTFVSFAKEHKFKDTLVSSIGWPTSLTPEMCTHKLLPDIPNVAFDLDIVSYSLCKPCVSPSPNLTTIKSGINTCQTGSSVNISVKKERGKWGLCTAS